MAIKLLNKTAVILSLSKDQLPATPASSINFGLKKAVILNEGEPAISSPPKTS